MASTRIKLNSREIQSYLDGKHGVSAMLHSRAATVLSAAQSSAPIGETGDYQAGLHIFEAHTDRLVVAVGSDVSYAMVVEANTGNLARALDSA